MQKENDMNPMELELDSLAQRLKRVFETNPIVHHCYYEAYDYATGQIDEMEWLRCSVILMDAEIVGLNELLYKLTSVMPLPSWRICDAKRKG